jgi:chemotaxis protein methyltransferase CheR
MQAAAFAFVRQLVKRQAAIVIEPDKEYLAEMRLASLALESGHADVEALVATLRAQPPGELHRRVIEVLTTNETSFFRDQRSFDALRTTIVPELADKLDRPLAIWCAAAASGQEPYSIAMLLLEHFPRTPARIIASDLSRTMLARIDRGTYSAFETARGLPAPLLAKYFTHDGAGWKVRPALRAMLEIRELNLATPFALPPIDIAIVRNVLIYFDTATKLDILTRVRRVLAARGVLLLGAAENTLGLDAGFERCTAERAIYYRPVARGVER